MIKVGINVHGSNPNSRMNVGRKEVMEAIPRHSAP